MICIGIVKFFHCVLCLLWLPSTLDLKVRIIINSPSFFYHRLTHNTYLNLFKNHTRPGGHSVKPRRGRKSERVKAVFINDLLERVRPTKVKMDIEYAEYDIIPNIKPCLWPDIQAISIEFHFNHGFEQYRNAYKHLG